MCLSPELREERTCHGVPVTVAPRPPNILRQQVQHLLVLWGRLQKLGVIIHRGGDEGVILGLFPFPVLPVHEQPLYPQVADAAWVAGQVHPPGELGRAAQARAQRAELGF